MPIYEFYCSKCHTLFNFFSHSINTNKQPNCPACGKKKLSRQVSMFAAIGGDKHGAGEEGGELPFDEPRMEQAMMALAGEAENLNEEDPRSAAQLMRKMSAMTGMKFSSTMEEALSRLEAGDDPETIEQEMGALMDGDELPFEMPGSAGGKNARPLPRRDETLYDL